MKPALAENGEEKERKHRRKKNPSIISAQTASTKPNPQQKAVVAGFPYMSARQECSQPWPQGPRACSAAPSTKPSLEVGFAIF